MTNEQLETSLLDAHQKIRDLNTICTGLAGTIRDLTTLCRSFAECDSLAQEAIIKTANRVEALERQQHVDYGAGRVHARRES